MAKIADGYLDDLTSSRALTRPFTEACLKILKEADEVGEGLNGLKTLVKTLLKVSG